MKVLNKHVLINVNEKKEMLFVKQTEKKGKFQMYVLSVIDLQRILECNYQSAYKVLRSYEYFYINSKPYILASDFYNRTYRVGEVFYYEPLTEGIETKVISVRPRIYSVEDIRIIFNCGLRQAYEIIDMIPGTFTLKQKKYVTEEMFVDWLKTLPNTRGEKRIPLTKF